MKKTIKTNHRLAGTSKGFTLIEILIVIGVIGMIVALAIPAYNYVSLRGRVTSAKGTAYQLGTEVQALIGQPGSGTLPITESVGTSAVPASEVNGTGNTAALTSAASTFDLVLLNAGLLQQPIHVTMGSQVYAPTGTVGVTWVPASQYFTSAAAPSIDYSAVTRVECAAVDTTATPGVNGAAGINFQLDGVNSLQSGARVVYLIIKAVPANDAYALAKEIDGEGNVGASASVAQLKGAVAYAAPVNQQTDVFYYIYSQ